LIWCGRLYDWAAHLLVAAEAATVLWPFGCAWLCTEPWVLNRFVLGACCSLVSWALATQCLPQPIFCLSCSCYANDVSFLLGIYTSRPSLQHTMRALRACVDMPATALFSDWVGNNVGNRKKLVPLRPVPLPPPIHFPTARAFICFCLRPCLGRCAKSWTVPDRRIDVWANQTHTSASLTVLDSPLFGATTIAEAFGPCLDTNTDLSLVRHLAEEVPGQSALCILV